MTFSLIAVGGLVSASGCCLSLFAVLCVYLQVRPLMNLVKYMFPRVFWFQETQQNVLALTIDDAPSEHTNAILDLLDEYECKATFFIIASQARSKVITNSL